MGDGDFCVTRRDCRKSNESGIAGHMCVATSAYGATYPVCALNERESGGTRVAPEPSEMDEAPFTHFRTLAHTWPIHVHVHVHFRSPDRNKFVSRVR